MPISSFTAIQSLTKPVAHSRRFPVRFFSLKKTMNFGHSPQKGSRGRGRRIPTTPAAVNRSVRYDSPMGGGDSPSRDVDKHAHNSVQSPLQDKHHHESAAPSYDDEYPPLGAGLDSSLKRKMRIDLGSEQKTDFVVDSPKLTDVETAQSSQKYSQHEEGARELDFSEDYSPNVEPFRPFDICFRRRRNYLAQNVKIVREPDIEGTRSRKVLLRPGMVLLRHHIRSYDQIQIVKLCQKLGKGPGGLYQPVFKNGAKLKLQMMCLGLNWDPETRKYEQQRSFDGCEPPRIPGNFIRLVHRAIRDAHALIRKEMNEQNVEDILPGMIPDICIVNFYKTSGRLGLHQDRDESENSLERGLPVVSFSIGDSAEFLYGDERDMEMAEKVVLHSGDVLIFGGDSRHIFHGVSSIIPNSAPDFLLERTGLRPGRINLTFRQY